MTPNESVFEGLGTILTKWTEQNDRGDGTNRKTEQRVPNCKSHQKGHTYLGHCWWERWREAPCEDCAKRHALSNRFDNDSKISKVVVGQNYRLTYIRSEESRETSVPSLPMTTPISVAFKARASFTITRYTGTTYFAPGLQGLGNTNLVVLLCISLEFFIRHVIEYRPVLTSECCLSVIMATWTHTLRAVHNHLSKYTPSVEQNAKHLVQCWVRV